MPHSCTRKEFVSPGSGVTDMGRGDTVPFFDIGKRTDAHRFAHRTCKIVQVFSKPSYKHD